MHFNIVSKSILYNTKVHMLFSWVRVVSKYLKILLICIEIQMDILIHICYT